MEAIGLGNLPRHNSITLPHTLPQWNHHLTTVTVTVSMATFHGLPGQPNKHLSCDSTHQCEKQPSTSVQLGYTITRGMWSTLSSLKWCYLSVLYNHVYESLCQIPLS